MQTLLLFICFGNNSHTPQNCYSLKHLLFSLLLSWIAQCFDSDWKFNHNLRNLVVDHKILVDCCNLLVELMMIDVTKVDYRTITDCRHDFLVYQRLFIFEVFSSSTGLLQKVYSRHLFRFSMLKSYLHLEFPLKIDSHQPWLKTFWIFYIYKA